MTAISPRIRAFCQLAAVLVSAASASVVTAAAPHPKEPQPCGEVRRLLRLHMYTEAQYALRLIRGPERTTGRCTIPSDVLLSMARANNAPEQRIPVRRHSDVPLRNGRLVHHLLTSTAGAMLTGYMIAGVDRTEDDEEILGLALSFGISSLALQGGAAAAGSSDRFAAALHAGMVWGSLTGAILGADWSPPDPRWGWFRDDDGLEGALVGMFTLGPLLAAGMKGSGASYDQISQVSSTMAYSITTTWLLLSAAGAGQGNQAKVPLVVSIASGLVGGGIWSAIKPLPRWRVTLIDLGGVFGALAGSGTMLLIAGNRTSPTMGSMGAAVGLLGGMVAGGVLGPHLAPWLRPGEAGVAARF